MILHLDIETIPAGDKLTKDEISHPSKMTKKETIDNWRKNDSEAAIEKEYRDRAKHSLKGQILCIGVAYNSESPLVLYHKEEKEIMLAFEKAFKAETWGKALSYSWCGWNIRKFDMIWLWHRVVKYNLDFLRRFMPLKKWSDRIIDLMEWFSAPDYREMTKLDDACRFLGHEGKGDIDGSKVYDYYKDGKIKEICDYCAKDVKKNQKIFDRMGIELTT